MEDLQNSALILPVVVHIMHPPRRKNSEQSLGTFLGRCPIITQSYITATAYLSCSFSGCLLHSSISPTTASHIVSVSCGTLHLCSNSSMLFLFCSNVNFRVRYFRGRHASMKIFLAKFLNSELFLPETFPDYSSVEFWERVISMIWHQSWCRNILQT